MNFRTRIVKIAAAVTLSATVVGIGTMAPAGAATDGHTRGEVTVAGDPSQWGRASIAGDPSQWGLAARKVNEYEGQHRKVNEYEGQHRKVNEYEGQHR